MKAGAADPVPVGTYLGETVHCATLRGENGMEADVLTWGGVIRDLRVPVSSGALQSVVLGFQDFEDYPKRSPYFGAIVGRYANRIADGRFTLDGRIYQLDRNESGQTTLHGGTAGFSSRIWAIDDIAQSRIALSLVSKDGDQGFPGTVHVKCEYELLENGTLRFSAGATTDKPTPFNIAQHSYFNLDGSSDLRYHTLRINASNYTPTEERLIPTGEIAELAGTQLDFRQPRALDVSQDCDVNFVLDEVSSNAETGIAELASLKSGVRLTIRTSQPGLQVYNGHKLSIKDDGGKLLFGRCAGVCLETQHFPDSPNRSFFPNTILRPGQVFHSMTDYRFLSGEQS